MRNLVLVLTLLSSFCFTNVYAAKKESKETKKAKVLCLKENPEIKGKKLQTCIKEKLKK